MNDLQFQTQGLQEQVHCVLQLLQQEPRLRAFDTTSLQSSLRKAIAPTFEIVFAGAFSAGKSMLINALLERELLYSAEGHATGTECQIAYADAHQERVVLTFLNESEIQAQAEALCRKLEFSVVGPICRAESTTLEQLIQQCFSVIRQEGGESKSERAKQASGLKFLLEGFIQNRSRIDAIENQTFSMEQLSFSNLQDASIYARRGVNSAVLKRVEYYCCHPLLKDGNVLIDTPGIDAPVKSDAELTYRKIEHPDTSAVVCVLKSASTGELSTEETQLLETIRMNPGIRDRVFYVFNRVDEVWYNGSLRQRLETLLQYQFHDTTRVYQTSALLGFYGSQIRRTSQMDRYGLDTLFADTIRGLNGSEETPQFVNEFNRYCASSGKLPVDRFRVDVRSYETSNENYVRILGEQGQALIEQLVADSGIEQFRIAINQYLTEEKRPQLLANLADDLHPLCIQLHQHYLNAWHELQNQPQSVEAIKEQELRQLGHDLHNVGNAFRHDIERVVNETIASNSNAEFEHDFRTLKARMVSRLDELLNTFSVGDVHRRAQQSHRRNSVVPLLGILAEAFYYLANGLEDVLVDCVNDIIAQFFQRLIADVKTQDYYRQLYRLLGNDGGIEQTLHQLRELITQALVSEARTECDRYVRERPEFFAEETASIWQLRQTLQQACLGYDYQTMVGAESAIRQLLKMDFEQKVKETVLCTFRQTINQTLNHHLLAGADKQANLILQQYDHARDYLVQVLEKEALERIRFYHRQQSKLCQQIRVYNEAIHIINQRLDWLQLERRHLPLVSDVDLGESFSALVAEDLKVEHDELVSR